MPFFSIITATRNAAAVLPRLLDSLAGQTCRDFELILQDGASEDNTVAMAESRHAGLPVLSMESEPDNGIYDAWNKALARVRGQWVLFLGADDILHAPDTLERCRELLQTAAPNIRYAVGDVDQRDRAGEIMLTMRGQAAGAAARLPCGYGPFCQNGLFHRANLFADNRFDASLRIAGDYDFICRTWRDDAALRIPFTVVSIALGGLSNSPLSLVRCRLESLRVSRRHYGNRALPTLCRNVIKAGIAFSLYKLLGPDRACRFMNTLRKKRGLAPTWSCPVPASTPARPVTRQLNHGYLYHNRAAIIVLQSLDALLRSLPREKSPLPRVVRSILIIKPDHLGDLFLMGAALPLIEQRFPGCAIDLVTGSWNLPLVSAFPGLRDVFVVDHWMHNRRAVPLWKKLGIFMTSFCETLRRTRPRRYDLCLCLRAFGGNLISLGYLSKPACLAGHGAGGLGPLLDAEAVWQSGRHETEHCMEVLSLAKIPSVPTADLRYPLLSGADPAHVESLKRELDIPYSYLVIAPCSGLAAKMLPPAYWRRMIEKAPEVTFVISVASSEETFARAISHGLPNARIQAGRFSLPDLALFLRGAGHIHTVDSFGAHLAGASGRPTTVHCRTGGADMRQFRPLGQQVRCVFVEDGAI